ncbi:MAG: S-layer homology domain-containing protein [Clostridiales bacterium]|nr:S-layer homology domain-containing protein [Clostridiales bacterium]
MSKKFYFAVTIVSLIVSVIVLGAVFSNRVKASDEVQIYFFVDIPAVGECPSYDVVEKNSNSARISDYSITGGHVRHTMKNGVEWYESDGDDWYLMEVDHDKITVGHEYKIIIYFSLRDGVTGNPYPNVNWKYAKNNNLSAAYQKLYGVDYYCEYVFTPQKKIDTANIGLDLPVADCLLDYVLEIPEEEPYYQELKDLHSPKTLNWMTWYKLYNYSGESVNWETHKAVRDGQYYAQIKIYAKDGYVFTEDTVCSINNVQITDNSDVNVYNEGKLLDILTPKYNVIPPEDFYQKINDIDVSLSEPINGSSADYVPKYPEGAAYSCKNYNMTWFDTTDGTDQAMNPSNAKFSKGHKYRVDITLTASENYCFDVLKNLKAKVNNKEATVEWIDSYNVIVSQTFDLSVKPTSMPTAVPSVTSKPTAKPTEKANPTKAPTSKPTATATPTAVSNVALTLSKKTATVVCSGKFSLKATLTGSKAAITWTSSDPKVASVDTNGNITAKMAGTVSITASAAGKTASCTVTVLYKDVTKASDFWYAPTNYLTAAGVVKGYDNQTLFKPANVCTRAQMVTFIWRLQGQPDPKTKTCKFKDVKEKDYFYKACIWGNENHIVEGYKDGTFGPQIVCARKHAVTFLWRLAKKPDPKSATNKFKDVKTSDYFYKAVLWASEKKIVAGYSDGTFKPNGDCLRRQMVTFLYKYDKFINGKG